MYAYVSRLSLLVVVIVAYVTHLAPVGAQCTTGYCHDDGDNAMSVLTATATRLLDTVEQLHQQLTESTVLQQLAQQQLRDWKEQQRQQSNGSMEQLQKQLQQTITDSKEQQHQQLRDSMEQLQKQLQQQLQQHMNDSTELHQSLQQRLQLQLSDSMVQLQRQLQQQMNDSAELQQQLQQQFRQRLEHQLRKSSEQHEKQLKKLKETLSRQEQFLTRRLPARDCYDLLKDGNNVSGVYEIYLAKAAKYIRVYCDMETDGGGWLVFQRRKDGSVDFYRGWTDYKEGFGDLAGEFWFGNDNLHDLTSQARYKLRIDLEDFNNETRFATYSKFAIASEGDKYTISVGTYSGTAGDALSVHTGHPFSTKDRDNDKYDGHCATLYKGAWWYTKCHSSNLNGAYLGGSHTSYADGVDWKQWHGYHYSLKRVQMKLRP